MKRSHSLQYKLKQDVHVFTSSMNKHFVMRVTHFQVISELKKTHWKLTVLLLYTWKVKFADVT